MTSYFLLFPDSPSKLLKILACGALVSIVLGGCSKTLSSGPSAESLQTGIVRACKWTMGEEACGKCYALETTEHGSEIVDYSLVGDLASFLDKRVKYEGSRDPNVVHSTKMCPKYLKLTKVSLAAE